MASTINSTSTGSGGIITTGDDSSVLELQTDGVTSVAIDGSQIATFSKGVRETKVAVAASNIDLSTGTYFTKTISGSTTFTVSNVASSGTVSSFVLELTNGGSDTVAYFSGVTWAGGTAPTLTASGVDVLAFFTSDGGTTWRGFVLGLDMAAP
jgi:hypothetical protein